MGDVIGSNPNELRLLARRFRDGADALDRAMRAVNRQVLGAPWRGKDASMFRAAWDQGYEQALRAAMAGLRQHAEALDRNAAEQDTASAPVGMAGSLGGLEPSRSVHQFGSFGSGRDAVVEALHGTTDSRRADYDEIEIRRLDNGRYVVVLPGVVDLTQSLEDGAGEYARSSVLGPVVAAQRGVDAVVDSWYEGRPDVESAGSSTTVRRMEYANAEANHGREFVNPYAQRVKQQMEAAGIPNGAEVMIVGHSFGAYTAMDLAADRGFNTAFGGDGYRVDVTHVVAAGADVDWRLQDLPSSTNALIVNNRWDLAVAAEDSIHREAHPQHSGQVDVTFSGGVKGAGHHPDNYTSWLSRMDDPRVAAWLDDAGGKYTSGGTAFSVKVPDDP